MNSIGRLSVSHVVLLCLAFALVPTAAIAQSPSIDFEKHVAPLLGKHGCNAAACHGAFGGKGGLQLSLFGYSPQMDFENLQERIDYDDPEQSLVLLKPTGQEEHEGGVRFSNDSEAFGSIKAWIKSGAQWNKASGKVTKLRVAPSQIAFARPGEESQTQYLTVTALFADGSEEDVTRLARFTSRDEGLVNVDETGNVSPARPGFASVIVSYGNEYAAVDVVVPFKSPRSSSARSSQARSSNYATNNEVDGFINGRLKSLNLRPSVVSTDEAFLRRIMIDVIGTVPTAGEVEEFCDDDEPNKRESKIDELLAHPMHAALWASRMCEITKCDSDSMQGNDSDRITRAQMWHAWFRKRFEANIPYDKVVRDIVSATSREKLTAEEWLRKEETLVAAKDPASIAKYADKEQLDLFWRRKSEGGFPIEETSELTAAAFAGIRINCARCHKHPFDRWSQDDYAAFANIFSGVVYGSSTQLNVAIFNELDRRREAKKTGRNVDPLPQMKEVYNNLRLGRTLNGSSPKSDVNPRPLGGEGFDLETDFRIQFGEWLTAKDNPYFAKNFANRVWSVYFGVGLVEPVDDFSISNPPSHPQLLKMLEKRFVESGFDIRELEKSILMSAAYQRSSTPNGQNARDQRAYSRQYLRPMPAEVTLDVINKALGANESFDGHPDGLLAIELGSNRVKGSAARAFEVFGRGKRESVCDCDRRKETDLRQAMYLLSDATIHEKIRTGEIQKLLDYQNRKLINQLFLTLLGREPNQQERKLGLQHLTQNSRKVGFEDLVWSLINSREFITNH